MEPPHGSILNLSRDNFSISLKHRRKVSRVCDHKFLKRNLKHFSIRSRAMGNGSRALL